MRRDARLPVVMGFVLAAAVAAPAQQNPGSSASKELGVRVQTLEVENAKLRADNKRLAAELAQRRGEVKRGLAQDLDRTVESMRKISKKLETDPTFLRLLTQPDKQPPAEPPNKRRAEWKPGGAPGTFFQVLAGPWDEKPSPPIKGEFRAALQVLQRATNTLRRVDNIKQGMSAIDEASKALMEARAALWEQRGAAEKKDGREKPVRIKRSKKQP